MSLFRNVLLRKNEVEVLAEAVRLDELDVLRIIENGHHLGLGEVLFLNAFLEDCRNIVVMTSQREEGGVLSRFGSEVNLEIVDFVGLVEAAGPCHCL